MLIKDLSLNRKSFTTNLITIFGGFIFGCILLFIMTSLQVGGILKDDTYTVAMVGTLMSASFFYMVFVFVGLYSINNQFDLLVGFGMTRKRFIKQELFSSYVALAIGTGIIVVFYHIEKVLLKLSFYSQFPYEELFSKNEMKVFVFIILVLPVLRLFMGSVLAAAGNKGFWFLWIIWMMIALGPNVVKNIMTSESRNGLQEMIYKVIAILSQVSPVVWLSIGIVITIILLIVSYIMIMKHSVR